MNATLCLLLCHVFMEGGIAYQHEYAGPIHADQGNYWLYDRNHFANPLGVVALGLEYQPRYNVSVRIELWRHESFIGTARDHGSDTSGMYVRWSPWSKR